MRVELRWDKVRPLDCFLIHQWREGAESLRAHLKWFRHRYKRGLFWIVRLEGQIPVGYIRIDPNTTDGNYYVSYLVAPEYRRKGFGQQFIARLTDMWLASHHPKRLVAYVEQSNMASNTIFRRAGWRLASEGEIMTYVLEAPDADTCADHGHSADCHGDGTADDLGGGPAGGAGAGGPERQ